VHQSAIVATISTCTWFTKLTRHFRHYRLSIIFQGDNLKLAVAPLALMALMAVMAEMAHGELPIKTQA
jgi:hypothetical protein